MSPLKYFLLFLATAISLVPAQGGAYASRAMAAAASSNCLRGYTGKLTTSDRASQVCENGFPKMDSYVTRLCEGNECDGMRLRPFAKVVFNCGETPESVTCI